jgi:hypothetical protein
MALIYKLKREDGTPADPPTFRSSPGTSWKAGDMIHLGNQRVSEFLAAARTRTWTATLSGADREAG